MDSDGHEQVPGRAGASKRPSAPPAGEQPGGAAEARGADSSTLPPSPPSSSEKRRGSEEARGVDSSPVPPSPPPSGRSAAAEADWKRMDLAAAPPSGSNKNEQMRRPSFIKMLRKNTGASRPRCTRDSIDISYRRRWRLRRRKINWPSILRAWPESPHQANNCAQPRTSLRDKVATRSKNAGNSNMRIKETTEKLHIACRGRTKSIRNKYPVSKLLSNSHGGTSPTKRRIVLVRTAADIKNKDPDSSRILLANNLSGTDLDTVFLQVVRSHFKKFVNNGAFQRAVLRRFCSIYDAEVRSKTSRK